MRITELDLEKDTILEREDNPNKMDEAKVSALVQLIKKLGFLQPILVREEGDSYRIVDGHHRVKASRMVELPTISAVVVDDGDDASQYEDLLQIAMNQIRGELDIGMVGDSLASMRENGFTDEELAMTGFSMEEIDDLILAVSADEEEILTAIEIPEETVDDDNDAQLFVIEVVFDNKPEYQQAKKALKRAAGKGNDLSAGLLNLIGAQ